MWKMMLQIICFVFALYLPAKATNIVGDVFCTDRCKSTGIRCTDSYSYQLCMNITDDYAVSMTTTKTCPSGTICDDGGTFPCKVGTITTTTVAPSTTQPACSGDAKYPTNSCNTYFQCVQLLWWWAPEVQTCPDGQNFNPNSLECVDQSQYSCGAALATTTLAPDTPTCSWFGNLPGPTVNQYYECVFVWFTFQAQLRTCPDNQIFNESAGSCADSDTT